MELGLQGRRALITGAASGIGKATALLLASEGVELSLVDIDKSGLLEVADEASGFGVSVALGVGDLSNPDGVDSALDEIEHAGTVDILVSCVGNASVRSFDDLIDEDWQHSFNLNLMSTVRVSRRVLPGMRSREKGSIVNVSSDFGRQPESISLDYAAAKAGVLAITKGLAMSEAPRIRVNAVAPGPIATPLWFREGGFGDTLGQFHGMSRDDAIAYELKLRRLPMGRLGEAHEVANVIVFLVSDLASFVTNSVYGVDGGSVRSVIA